MTHVIGVDISKYNIGWNPVNATEMIYFAIQRMSYGTRYGNYKDQQADIIYPLARKVPVLGAYHYFSSYINWKPQADFFLSVVKDKNYDFYAVDYEKAYNVLDGRTIAEFAEFVKYIKQVTGKRVLAYFNWDVYVNFVQKFGYASWANSQDVWYANYPYGWFLNLDAGPKLPAGLAGWKFWQYGAGDVALTAGYNAGAKYGGGMRGIDLNLFNGQFEDLVNWVIGTNPIPPTPPVEISMAYVLPRPVLNDAGKIIGPSIVVGSDAPQPNHPTYKLGSSQQTFISQLNNHNARVMGLFYADDVGPTKGMDFADNPPTMKYIPATWSGNVVKANEHESGWVKIDAINLNSLPRIIDVNRISTPWKVSKITTYNVEKEEISYPIDSPWNYALDPIMSPTGYLWLPEEWLKFEAITNVRLNVRSGPGTTYAIRTTLPLGSKLKIYNVGVDILKNIWGKIGTNDWICLKQGIYQYTDWKLANI